ncbi:bifunctional demethylmenaquinone methyltransferase/2-methoxy-6-polyprenyl-1,4-benzoquinol methylase UbiE [bacterium]|nr:bifunctional demethylmenaquinone methyltransferase/2-methoxy-6-polyprenyl-1,4-benzoquinol methylase UbiE [bacterium]
MKNSLTKKTFSVAKIFNEIAEKYDSINSLLSFGLDKRWRKKLAKRLPEKKGANVLDVACGSCEQILANVKKRPSATFTGIDISEKLLNIGREKIKEIEQVKGLYNVSALDLPFSRESYDAITLSFGIRNMEKVEIALEEAYRVLKKGGKLLILEFSLPKSWFAKKLALFYLKNILPIIGNLISKHSYAYTYLNETIQDFPYGEDFDTLMKKASFTNTSFSPLTFGMVTIYAGEKGDA